MATGGEAHVQTKLFTKLKKYKTGEPPFSLPIAAGCLELNSVLTSLLFDEQKESKDIKFDFLINGEFLRTTLKEFIESHNLSTEVEVEIEYILKEDEPQLSQTLEHDDWVSAIDINVSNLILTSTYDNRICLWTLNGKSISCMEGHSMAVKDACWIDNKTFISCSQDQTILLWEMKEGKDQNHPDCVHICRGHAGSVDCLSVNQSKERFASGSWDKMIKIWECKIDRSAIEDVEEEAKKTKTNDNHQQPAPLSRTPLSTLTGHKEAVSDVLWKSSSELISSGWDHCIRIWDVDTATNSQTLNGNKVFLTIDYSKLNHLIAAGSTDKLIRLYDPRTTEGTVVKSMLSSSNGYISALQWTVDNENHLLSGSFDSSVKLWDIRNTTSALLDLEKHKDKVMCVNSSKPGLYLSGGADCLVHISSKRKQSSPVASEE